MSFESTTLGVLTGNSAVTALVPSDSIFFGTAPENQPGPLVVCYKISTTPTLSTDNGQAGSSELDNIRLQVSFWARTGQEAVALEKAIRRALEAARPTIYILQDARGAYDDTTDLHGKIQEYSCWHPDQIPA